MITLPQAKLDGLLSRHAMLEAELSRQIAPETFVKLSREFAEIDPVVAKVKAYRDVMAEIADLRTGMEARFSAMDARFDAVLRAVSEIVAEGKPH